MEKTTVTSTTIRVHGREALRLPVNDFQNIAGVETQVSVANRVMFFEVPKARIRKQLAANPANALELLIYLTRAEVSKLQLNTGYEFALIDETTVPDVLWNGTLTVIGYISTPA